MGSVGKHRGAVAAKPFYMRNAAVAGRKDTLAVTRTKFPLFSTYSHPAVQTVGLAVLIRSVSPSTKYLVARELEVHFPLPGRSRETVQCVSNITVMTPPRPPTDKWPVIFSTSSI